MKMDGMDMMADMQKGAHHSMMMGHRQNVLTFAKTLRDMAAGGKLEDVELARNAFAEIIRSAEKMEEIQKVLWAEGLPTQVAHWGVWHAFGDNWYFYGSLV